MRTKVHSYVKTSASDNKNSPIDWLILESKLEKHLMPSHPCLKHIFAIGLPLCMCDEWTIIFTIFSKCSVLFWQVVFHFGRHHWQRGLFCHHSTIGRVNWFMGRGERGWKKRTGLIWEKVSLMVIMKWVCDEEEGGKLANKKLNGSGKFIQILLTWVLNLINNWMILCF